MAGEVTGSGKNIDQNQGKSWCSFSGLNDKLEGEGPTGPQAQSYGQDVKLGDARIRTSRIPASSATRTTRRWARTRTGPTEFTGRPGPRVGPTPYSSRPWMYARNSGASSGRCSASSTDAFSQPIVVPQS